MIKGAFRDGMQERTKEVHGGFGFKPLILKYALITSTMSFKLNVHFK